MRRDDVRRRPRLKPGSLNEGIHALVASHEEGMTCEEVERFHPERGHQCVSARMYELHAHGLLTTVPGLRRRNRTGHWATVYFAVSMERAVPPARADAATVTMAKELLDALRFVVDAHGRGSAALDAAVAAARVAMAEAEVALRPRSRRATRRATLRAAAAMTALAANRDERPPTTH